MRTQLYSHEYDEITNIANLVIAKYVKSYPLDIDELMASIKTIRFMTYSEYGVDDRHKCFEMSETGYSYKCGNRMFVVYNDQVPDTCRMYSVLHELGHLGDEHAAKRELFFDDLCARYEIDAVLPDELSGEAGEEYKALCERQEKAANYFADVLAAPNWLIDKIKPEIPWDLCEILDIGYTCAEMRWRSYRRWVRLGKPRVSPVEAYNARMIVLHREGRM